MTALEAIAAELSPQQLQQLVVTIPVDDGRTSMQRAPLMKLLLQPDSHSALQKGSLRLRLAALLLQVLILLGPWCMICAQLSLDT